MRVTLISPKNLYRHFWDLKISAKLTGKKYGGNPPLALPTIAALTPPDVDVKIIDENVEPINFDEKVDIVGITFMTPLAPRAYQIADEFKKRGATVVLGGIHVSMLPEEAIQHADAIVIGEAENIWEELIVDFQKAKLQKIYKCEQRPDLKDSPIPRWDLLKKDAYNIYPVQTSRGCPFDCDFCAVKAFMGGKYRHKPIENVIKEVQTLQDITNNTKSIFFCDDNINADTQYAKALFHALIPLGIRYWWGQASIKVAKDEELLSLMYKSGCRQLFIGLESISPQTIKLFGKDKVNKVEEYKEAIEIIHSHGIAVFGSFILGSDYDDEGIFEETVKFIEDSNIAFSMINILTPFPGTRLYQRLEDEGRILHKDWEKYNSNQVCIKPKLMSSETLQNGHNWVLRRIYSFDSLYERLRNLWKKRVLVRDRSAKLFTKGRIFVTLRALLVARSLKEIWFLLKSLWNSRKTSITSVLLALNFHDYAFSLPKVFGSFQDRIINQGE